MSFSFSGKERDAGGGEKALLHLFSCTVCRRPSDRGASTTANAINFTRGCVATTLSMRRGCQEVSSAKILSMWRDREDFLLLPSSRGSHPQMPLRDRPQTKLLRERTRGVRNYRADNPCPVPAYLAAGVFGPLCGRCSWLRGSGGPASATANNPSPRRLRDGRCRLPAGHRSLHSPRLG